MTHAVHPLTHNSPAEEEEEEEVQKQVKQQGRTTPSECGHNSPSYLSLWRQAITLASSTGGRHWDR